MTYLVYSKKRGFREIASTEKVTVGSYCRSNHAGWQQTNHTWRLRIAATPKWAPQTWQEVQTNDLPAEMKVQALLLNIPL
jgi:hypothetical protein